MNEDTHPAGGDRDNDDRPPGPRGRIASNREGAHAVTQLYLVEFRYDGNFYVCANGFDEAVRKIHEDHWNRQLWPRELSDPITETPIYGHEVRNITLLGEVVL
jgi:hypothetical protein